MLPFARFNLLKSLGFRKQPVGS